MDFKDILAKAQEEVQEVKLVEVSVAGELFRVEVSRLPGMDWSAIMVACPPRSPKLAGIGYDLTDGALLACERHSRFLDADDEVVADVDWAELFTVLAGSEVQGIAATWWTLNMRDPNTRVVELKKALVAGEKASLS